jgi:alkanesulfonate monooxygenase SsuD/methylene tetrahydromethanopterin reductase-like flavin-dependent oxidoreductase (luciferase family)
VTKIWAQLPVLPAAALDALVRSYEGAGLEGVWSPQMFGAPFSTLAAAAMASERLQLGTGIALAFTRSPLETVQCA